MIETLPTKPEKVIRNDEEQLDFFASESDMPGLDEQRICTLMRHMSDDVPYEYINIDEKYIRKTLERMYSKI